MPEFKMTAKINIEAPAGEELNEATVKSFLAKHKAYFFIEHPEIDIKLISWDVRSLKQFEYSESVNKMISLMDEVKEFIGKNKNPDSHPKLQWVKNVKDGMDLSLKEAKNITDMLVAQIKMTGDYKIETYIDWRESLNESPLEYENDIHNPF